MTRVADGRWTEGRSEASIENHRVRGLAQGRAKQRLIKAHRDEYERYVAQERAKLSFEPLPEGRRKKDQAGSFLRSWALTAGIVATAFVVYFARHPGWTGAAALGIVVVSGVAAVAYLAARSGADPDRASVAEFEERRRALR